MNGQERAIQIHNWSTKEIINRMNISGDFGYDDESTELSRRLRAKGKTWHWVKIPGTNVEVVEIFAPKYTAGSPISTYDPMHPGIYKIDRVIQVKGKRSWFYIYQFIVGQKRVTLTENLLREV